MSLAEELAQFADYFTDAEAILLRLATEESEPEIANNATKTWKGLFRIFLSGTEVPFHERIELLRTRLSSANPGERKLAVLAAAGSVDRTAYKMVGPPLFGQLVPPPDWRPATSEEYLAAVRASIDILRNGTFDTDAEVSSSAKDALLDATSHLLWAGILDPVRQSLEAKTPADLRPRLAAVVREAYSRLNQNEQSGGGHFAAKEAIEHWLASLKSQTLHERLVEDVTPEPWSHHFEENEWRERINKLAQEIWQRPQALAEELAWLNSGSAKAAAEFGDMLGTDAMPTNFVFSNQITNAAIEHKADALARGYFFGAAESAQGEWKSLGQALDRIEAADVRLAYFVMLPAGDTVHSFDRAMAMAAAGRFPRDYSRTLPSG